MRDELIALIEAERIACGVPGASVAVVRDGEVLLAEGFGNRDVASVDAVTPRTLFAIGSATKAFTASVIGALVDSGELDWDRPVRSYLPELRMWDDALTGQITLRDMLSHRTGLPRHDLIWYGNPDIARQDFVGMLAHLQPSAPLRQRWNYNNIMFMVAGHLVERVLGTSWEEAVCDRLLDPLGMSRTNFSVEQTQRDPDHSSPHLNAAGVTSAIPFRDLSVTGPAGSINSCVEDLAAWLAVNLDGGHWHDREVIAATTLTQLHTPAMLMPPAAVAWPEVRPVGYALGWFIDDYRGERVVHHGGNIDGFSAMIALTPRARIGVAILTNLDNSSLRDSVPRLVFDALLGQPKTAWGERHRVATAALVDGPAAAAESRARRAGGHPPTRPLHEYAGVYTHPAYGRIEVSVSAGGELAVRYHQLGFELVHHDYDAFELRQDAARMNYPLRFEADFDGRVSRLVTPLEPAVAAIEFIRTSPPLPESTLTALPGDYTCGPLLARVTRGSTGLLLSVANQPAAPLEHRYELTFGLGGQPNTTVVFTLDDADAEVAITSTGRFTRRIG